MTALRNNRIAYIDRVEKLPDLTWEQLDTAIDVVTEVFERYAWRLTGVSYQIDFSDSPWLTWRSVFSKPLSSMQVASRSSRNAPARRIRPYPVRASTRVGAGG